MPTRREFILRTIAAPASPLLAHATAQAQTQGRVTGYDHVALPVLNVEQMAAFYKNLGFRIDQGATLMAVHFGDQKINFHMPQLWRREEFSLRAKAARPGSGDLCLVWEGSRDALKSTLDRAGATIIEGPIERVGGRKGGTAKATSVYFYDPDGNLVEFMTY
jgi:catechol 2,3-dioxygenase-like lactoylglutathione lyase family enzyme